MDKCFCHLNGYKVKDADARRMLSGETAMGDIKVGSVKSKNKLYMLNIENTTKNGITVTVNNDKSVTFNGTANATTIFYVTKDTWGYTSKSVVLDAGTYTFKSIGTTYEKARIFIDAFNENNKRIYGTQSVSNNDLTFTIEEKASFNIRIEIPSGSILDNVTIGFQIEEGSVATEYAAYFELATKEDLKNVSTGDITLESKGYYYAKMPLGVLNHGDDIVTNYLPSTCYSELETLANKIIKDEVNQAIVVVENTNIVSVPNLETITKYSPRGIIFKSLEFEIGDETDIGTKPTVIVLYGNVSDFITTNTITSYDLNCILTINGEIKDGKFTILNGENTTPLQISRVVFLPTANNVEYTPTGDYNPATKKYVDEKVQSVNASGGVDLTNYATKEYVNDAVANVSGGSSSSSPSAIINLYTESSLRSGYNDGLKGKYSSITVDDNGKTNIGEALTEAYAKGITVGDFHFYISGSESFIRMTAIDTNYGELNLQNKPTSLTLTSGFTEMEKTNYQFTKVNNTMLILTLSWNGDVCNCTNVEGRQYENKIVTERNVTNTTDSYYLSKTNTSSYTPTSDYHPATKKYVDDNKITMVDLTSSIQLMNQDEISSSSLKLTKYGNIYYLNGTVNYNTNKSVAINVFNLPDNLIPSTDGVVDIFVICRDNFGRYIQCLIGVGDGVASFNCDLEDYTDVNSIQFCQTWML